MTAQTIGNNCCLPSDVVDTATRSRMMSGIRGANTRPELLIRRGLHRRGFRYRLHDRTLPGKPDMVFPAFRAVIFVNGCFWHQHECHLFKWPATREEFWRQKISRNREKDKENLLALEAAGWRSLTIWECAVKGRHRRAIDEVFDLAEDWLRFGARDSEISGLGDDRD